MSTTLFAVGVLFFISPAFVARAAHFTTSFYKFSRLARAERFLPFFANEWQIIFLYALVYSLIIHFLYWRILTWIIPSTWPLIKELVTSVTMRMDMASHCPVTTYSVGRQIYHCMHLYIGLLLFAYVFGKTAGFIRWNIVELYRKTVPNPWFYIVRPVGDDKITIIDVLTNQRRPNGNPVLYRGVATEIINGRDGKPLSITISKAIRLEPHARAILHEYNFTPVNIPGEKFVILFDEIENINVAQIIDIEPQGRLDINLRRIRDEFDRSIYLGMLINFF